MAALRERGVDYLMPSDAEGEAVSDETLIASLAASDDPRLRQSLIALFLVQPHLAPCVLSLQRELNGLAAKELQAHYAAAVYLRAMWEARLGRYIAPLSDLPDYFSLGLGLPAPEALHGKMGLHALAEWHAQHLPYRANHLSEYLGVVEMLFESLKLKARRNAKPSAG